jgi:hypothetical protein
MSTTLFLAKKMGEGMGRSKVLFSKMQKGSQTKITSSDLNQIK